jgi:hypothetical protein
MSMGITMKSLVGIEHSVDFWRSAENPHLAAENHTRITDTESRLLNFLKENLLYR